MCNSIGKIFVKMTRYLSARIDGKKNSKCYTNLLGKCFICTADELRGEELVFSTNAPLFIHLNTQKGAWKQMMLEYWKGSLSLQILILRRKAEVMWVFLFTNMDVNCAVRLVYKTQIQIYKMLCFYATYKVFINQSLLDSWEMVKTK